MFDVNLKGHRRRSQLSDIFVQQQLRREHGEVPPGSQDHHARQVFFSLTTHCVPCNTFGEQREIYGWIRLFLSPPENKKAKFAFCTLKRKGGSTQKQPFLTVRFRGALLTKSVTLEFSQDTV